MIAELGKRSTRTGSLSVNVEAGIGFGICLSVAFGLGVATGIGVATD